MTNWIKHDSTEPPALAPAALVFIECEAPAGTHRVDEVNWSPGLEYLVLTDPEGIPYCSAEGLEPWAEYVFTDQHGRAWQSNRILYLLDQWRIDATDRAVCGAPDTHRHPGDWKDSLMRVWRS